MFIIIFFIALFFLDSFGLTIFNRVFILKVFIALLSNFPTFYIKHFTMHKEHTRAGAIRQLLYGCAYVREIIHWLKLVDDPPVHTHKPTIENTIL